MTRIVFSLLGSALLVVVLGASPVLAAEKAPTDILHVPEIEAGFHLLYQLKPVEARAQFEAWQKSHPEDPLGSAAEAASYLFEECYRQGILTSAFFLDNNRFLRKNALKPDPELRSAFFAAEEQAQHLAKLRLKTNSDDTNALFAMALSVGMQADYGEGRDDDSSDVIPKNSEPGVLHAPGRHH
jgi:hypothetical protein